MGKKKEIKAEELQEKKKVKEATEEKKKEKKALIANTSFSDRYTGTLYKEGTEFIIEEVEGTEKITDKKYKISKGRAEEIKGKGYID